MALLSVAVIGCSPGADDPQALVIATPWSAAARAACESTYRLDGEHPPITWVKLGPHRWGDACDRRGGVDLILGGPARQHQALADSNRLDPIDPTDPAPWRQAECPRTSSGAEGRGIDPRDRFEVLAEAKAVIARAGWEAGFEELVRRPVGWIPGADRSHPSPNDPREGVALVRGGRHADQARRFLAALARDGWITPAPPDAVLAARTDDLLADLLGAALVDARNERRDAQEALAARGHPAPAEAALGEVPPWPPASVAKLRADPARQALADALADQIAPASQVQDWLEFSWRRPKQAIDLSLLRELAQAEGGRLVREPRFRAWLRGEWTAWTQQLYRRVARLAGGYVPS